MATSPIKGIPYPDEYEMPFVESFEDLMEFLDRSMSSQYVRVDGFTAAGPESFSFVGSEPLDHLGGIGKPIRYREADFDPWNYGIIVYWDVLRGQCTIAGAQVDPAYTQVEIGGPELVVRRHLFCNGNYDPHMTDDLFWDVQGEAHQWNGSPGYLVLAKMVHKVPNGGSTEYVNVTKSTSLGGPWDKLLTANMGYGLSVPDSYLEESVFVDSDHYRFVHGNMIDCSALADAPNSAEDLTVELVFVLEGYQDQYCAGNSPSVLMTISGMPPGQSWQGLGNGAHVVCPASYGWNTRNWTTRWSYKESWYLYDYGDPYNWLRFSASYIYWPPTYLSNSSVMMAFSNGATRDTDSFMSSSKITGRIKDRLFTTFTLNGVTFSLSRGNGPWKYVVP